MNSRRTLASVVKRQNSVLSPEWRDMWERIREATWSRPGPRAVPILLSKMDRAHLGKTVRQQRVLIGGSFENLADLDGKVLRFIDYYNACEAHPCSWTYTGQPRAI